MHLADSAKFETKPQHYVEPLALIWRKSAKVITLDKEYVKWKICLSR